MYTKYFFLFLVSTWTDVFVFAVDDVDWQDHDFCQIN